MNKQKRPHEKTTSAKLYIYIGVGSRDLFIDEAHTALGIFLVFFPCMLPTPLCGIFNNMDDYRSDAVPLKPPLLVSLWNNYQIRVVFNVTNSLIQQVSPQPIGLIEYWHRNRILKSQFFSTWPLLRIEVEIDIGRFH